MKLKLFVFLATITANPAAKAAPIGSCADQSPCVSWKMTKLDSTSCTPNNNCPIEVCFIVNGGADGCAKGGDSGISHTCSQADANGCPRWEDPGAAVGPIMPGTTKTEGFSGINEFCQQGVPGETLYWVLKDGSSPSTTEVLNDVFTDEATDCQATVTCEANLENCGGQSNQWAKERTWTFTIPDNCDLCSDAPVNQPVEPPVESPVEPPTEPPVEPPLDLPLDPPVEPPVEPPVDSPIPESSPSGSLGDPHFKTWKNEHFEYHGQCDMVLTKNPEFSNGLGLDIQIRTKLVRFWSYIKNAAVRIGEDILEVEGNADAVDKAMHYWINLEYQGHAPTVGGFPLTITRPSNFKTRYEIDLSSKYPNTRIVLSTYKEFVRVDVEGGTEEAFGNAVGLLGDFNTGKTLARDGTTELYDFWMFGMEWQVLPAEPMLFHAVSEPQFPKRCIEPEDPQGERRRRLDESTVSEEQAEAACAKVSLDAADIKDCIYDILATQDLDMVGAY